MSDKKEREMNTNIKILGEINISMLKDFLEQTDVIIENFKQYKSESSLVNPLYLQPFPSIVIDISSYGGCTDVGSTILNKMDEMKELGMEVNTHCSGFAYSMAFIIYVNGMKRTADKYSKFMNHGSASYNKGYVAEQKVSVEFAEKCDEQFEQIIYDNTKMTKERVEKARLCYDWITYDDAVDLGIINAGYEGCEPDWDELDMKYTQGVALAVKTFAQFMDTEDEDVALELLYLGLSDILNGEEEEEDRVEDNDEDEEAVELTEEEQTLMDTLMIEFEGEDLEEEDIEDIESELLMGLEDNEEDEDEEIDDVEEEVDDKEIKEDKVETKDRKENIEIKKINPKRRSNKVNAKRLEVRKH